MKKDDKLDIFIGEPQVGKSTLNNAEKDFKMGKSWLKHFLTDKKMDKGWSFTEISDECVIVTTPEKKEFAKFNPQTGIVTTKRHVTEIQW